MILKTKKIKYTLLTILLLSYSNSWSQNAVIERKFKASYYDDINLCYKDTILDVYHFVRNGKIDDITFCIGTYDRRYVRQAYISFNHNNLVNFYSFKKTLKAAKEKFGEWKKKAVENGVTDFTKDMDDKRNIKKHRLEYHFLYNNQWYSEIRSSHGSLPMWLISPVFKVTKTGECILEIGRPEISGECYNPKVTEIKAAIMEATGRTPVATATTYNIYLQFRTEEQIQSLLDAFEVEDEYQSIMQEHKQKQNRKDSIDTLFK